MTRSDLLDRLSALQPWLRSRGVVRLRLFGSHARDCTTANSDVDLIADFAEQPSLIEIIALEQELGEKLGAAVDLATSAGLKPRARARIEAEAVDA